MTHWQVRFGLVCGLLMAALPAKAQLGLCNQTSDEIAVAVAYDTMDDVVSHGWYRIKAGACVDAITTPLEQPYYYYYAVSKTQNLEWSGPYRYCSSDNDTFEVKGAGSCEERGFHTLGFSQFSVENNKAFNFNIRSGNGPVTAPAAAPAAPAATAPAASEMAAPAAQAPATEAAPAAEAAPTNTAPAGEASAPAEAAPLE